MGRLILCSIKISAYNGSKVRSGVTRWVMDSSALTAAQAAPGTLRTGGGRVTATGMWLRPARVAAHGPVPLLSPRCAAGTRAMSPSGLDPRPLPSHEGSPLHVPDEGMARSSSLEQLTPVLGYTDEKLMHFNWVQIVTWGEHRHNKRRPSRAQSLN